MQTQKNRNSDFSGTTTRVARWFSLRRIKIPTWVYFGWLGMENCGIFYGHLV
jgi:hypothetical protein